MPTALVVIRNESSYRKEYFADGMRRAGYEIITDLRRTPKKDDVLLVWNRHPVHHAHALRYEAVGARVIVAENGWIGKGADGHKRYAMCLGHHNGAGTWRVGEADRWSPLGIDLKPWRETGEHILVLPSRGIGAPNVAQPRHWVEDVKRRLAKVTKRPVKVRMHPGIRLGLNDKSLPSLKPDLANCWAVVTWASGGGIKAIVEGVPVFHEFPPWIGAPAAKLGIDDLENPFLGDRLPMLHRMSWAMWSAEEIATGEPIKWLLQA